MEKLPNQADEELPEKYDVVFIGGGPATLSFFSFICRNKNFENFFANLNILILEKSETFGSGCLGKYGINSNTSAEGFVRLICFNEDENGKEEKQNLSPNKKKVNNETKNNFFPNVSVNDKSANLNNNNNNNNNNSASNFGNSAIFQKFKNKCVPIFEDLLHSNETKNLLNIGSKIAPLSMIGNFLDCVGNSIASYIFHKFNKRIFMNYCEVMRINVDYEKCFESSNLKVNEIKHSNIYPFEIFVEKHSNKNNNTSNNNSNKEVNNAVKHFTVKCKTLIMASGAQQKFDNKLKQDILKLISPSDFFHSDYVLQETGFNHFINNLKLKEKRRVVILGGSHSGFSCAWLLLNGFVDINKIKEQNKSIRLSSANNSKNNNNNNKANDNKNNNNGEYYKCKINPNCQGCKSLNCCFGSVFDRSWNKQAKAQNGHLSYNVFDNLEITILYRDHIKVYYPSEREALNDGYNVFDQNKAVNKNGNVYPFIGIRGDAKELYRKVVTGKEKRIKLQKANNFNEQKNFISKANAVIWACGYTTQKMNFFDANCLSKEIEFHLDSNNQFDVDKELRILNKKKNPFLNLFGIGQGYSTHSIELLSNGKYARADSVNLYNTYISKKLFKALDFIFNFTGESISINNNGNSNDANNNKENINKNGSASKMSSNNVKGNHIINEENRVNKSDKKSSKKIIQLMQNDSAILRSSNTDAVNNNNKNNNTNINSSSFKSKPKHNNSNINNNNGNNTNLAANTTAQKKTNGQNLFNSPNIKTVKVISNNLATLSSLSNSNFNGNSDSKKISHTKSSVLTNSIIQSNNCLNNNIINTKSNVQVYSNVYNSINMQNDLSKSQSNLKDKNIASNYNNNNNNQTSSSGYTNSTNGILRAKYSRGLDKIGRTSKSNFFKNNGESNLENKTNDLIKHEFSPPSRSIKSRSPANLHVIPTKRQSSRLKALQPISSVQINNNLTPNLYTNKNVLVLSRDKEFTTSVPASNNASNFISTSNNDVLKSSLKELNKETNFVSNSTYLRKGKLQDFPRNQVYFGKTQINASLRSINNNSINSNALLQNGYNNLNGNNHHSKYPSFNSPHLDKTVNRYEISPITNFNRSKSKYILYDSTKNFIGNNLNYSNGNYNFNYNLHQNKVVNLFGKI